MIQVKIEFRMIPKRTCFNLNHGITRGIYDLIQVKIIQIELEWAKNEHILTWIMAYHRVYEKIQVKIIMHDWLSSHAKRIYFNLNHGITRGGYEWFKLK